MDLVGLRKSSCKVIDLTNKRGTVETLTETKISCTIDEKVCQSNMAGVGTIFFYSMLFPIFSKRCHMVITERCHSNID